MSCAFGGRARVQRQERNSRNDGKAEEDENLGGGIVQLPKAGGEKAKSFFFGPFS